jgi:hypothetical protein
VRQFTNDGSLWNHEGVIRISVILVLLLCAVIWLAARANTYVQSFPVVGQHAVAGCQLGNHGGVRGRPSIVANTVVADGGAVLSIVLVGHPKLRNALLGPNMEEIGSRFAVFPFDGMAGHQADYIAWLLERCRADNVEPAMIIEPAAVDLLAARLRTPLQIEQYLTRAFEKAFEVGEKVVTATLAETVLSRQIDDLEPQLTRHGYDVKSIAEEFRIKPADVRLFLHGQLDPARARELTEQMLVAGLPV